MAQSTAAHPHADSGDSFDAPSTGYFPFVAWPVRTDAVFPTYPNCPDNLGCAGHADDSNLHSHHTHWERFGPSGVVVVQDDGKPARVSTSDIPDGPLTPEHALLLAREIETAATFALHYNTALPAGQVTE